MPPTQMERPNWLDMAMEEYLKQLRQQVREGILPPPIYQLRKESVDTHNS